MPQAADLPFTEREPFGRLKTAQPSFTKKP